MGIAGVLDAVRVEQQGLSGEELAVVFGGQFGREGERAQRGQGFAGREYVDPAAAEQIRRRMPAVEGPHLTALADLQEQYGDELLGDRTVGVGLAQVTSQGPLQPPQYAAEFGLVVHGLTEAAEDGGDGPDGADAVSAHVAHDHPYAVLGGDDLVQVTADRGPRSADSWAAATRRPSMRCGNGRSSTLCAAPATCRASLNSRSSAQRTWNMSPVPTAKKTALVTMRAPSPSCWASGQASLYVIAVAPHAVGSASDSTRRRRTPALIRITTAPSQALRTQIGPAPKDRSDSVDHMPRRDHFARTCHPNE